MEKVTSTVSGLPKELEDKLPELRDENDELFLFDSSLGPFVLRCPNHGDLDRIVKAGLNEESHHKLPALVSDTVVKCTLWPDAAEVRRRFMVRPGLPVRIWADLQKLARDQHTDDLKKL